MNRCHGNIVSQDWNDVHSGALSWSSRDLNGRGWSVTPPNRHVFSFIIRWGRGDQGHAARYTSNGFMWTYERVTRPVYVNVWNCDKHSCTYNLACILLCAMSGSFLCTKWSHESPTGLFTHHQIIHNPNYWFVLCVIHVWVSYGYWFLQYIFSHCSMTTSVCTTLICMCV